MSHLDRVSVLAKWLHVATLFYMVVLPVGVVVSLIIAPVDVQTAQARIATVAVSQNATQAQLWIAVVLQCLPVVVLLWTLNQMRLLFVSYRRKDVLTDACARLVQRIGFGFLGLAIVPFALIPVQSVLLSWANPAGQRSLTVGFTTDMLGFALAAGLLIVIGWAMRDASDVAAENRAFV